MKKKTDYSKLNIKEWCVEDRPREKYEALGAHSLSDAELLAILLRSGTREETAVDLAKRLMRMCDQRLANVSNLSMNELQQVNGIGKTKAVTLLAAFELGKRIRAEEKVSMNKFDNSNSVYEFMLPKIGYLAHEEFWVLYLNQALLLLKTVNVGRGGINSTIVDERVILRHALELSATQLILCHNHPSEDPHPSLPDHKITQRIANAAKVLNLKVADHIIICRDSYYSYRDMGRNELAM